MRVVRALSVAAVLTLIVLLTTSGGRAEAPDTQFFGIGDLPDGPGGVGSAVRDATRVGGVIYAVGSSTTTSVITPVPLLDTPVLWTSSGGPSGTLTMLPPGPNFPAGFLTGTPADYISAYAITPSATFIASQIRNNPDPLKTGTPWGRVALPALTNTLLGGGGFVSLSISDSGNVVYGQNAPTLPSPPAPDPPANNLPRVLLRYDNGVVTLPSFATELGLDPALAWALATPRATSTTGTAMVGVASVGPTAANGHFNGTNGTAFRYVHGVGVTAIPKLTVGGWNFPIALSADGNLSLVAGNSEEAPRGEVYLHNATTNATTALGSPNTAWFPRMLGGMTADGSVVAVTFANAPTGGPSQIGGLGLPTNNKYAYVHNSWGWFHLSSALAAQNIDMEALGWDPTNIAITGVRTVEGVDLVFGQGRRRTVGATNFVDGQVEGFVAQFPAGYLATFAVAPTPPADTSIVGAWALGTDTNTAILMYVFMRDGVYYQIGTGGFERGFYTWTAGGSYKIWTRRDDDGPGLSGQNGKVSRTLTIVGDQISIADLNCPGCNPTILTRVASSAGTILGGWVLGTPTIDGNSAVGVFTGSPTSGRYFFAQDFGGSEYGTENGNWTWNAGTLSFSGITIITAGSPHADSDNSQPAHLTTDGLGLVVEDPGVTFNLTRVVNPAAVLPVITNASLAAAGAEDTPFSYTVMAVNALTFGATGLPPGLNIDPITGVISGTPTTNGKFNVAITATNTFGSTDQKTLVLTFAATHDIFHGIGDLPGGNIGVTGVGSAVRDATRVNGALYAVGSAVAREQVICTAIGVSGPASNTPSGCTTTIGIPNLESPAWWTWTGSGSGTLAALPEGAVHTTTPPTNQIFAYAITPGAEYIAGQAHFTSNGTGTGWVRDTNSGGTLSIFSAGLSTNIPQVAVAMSDDGATLYGTREQRSARIDVVGTGTPGTTVTITTPLPLPPTATVSQPVARGTTSDGAVMVGVASNGALGGNNGLAFRYTKATNTFAPIPFLPGGFWNYPVAISSTGAQTVVAGNSEEFPNGEVYLTSASNALITTLGSPNTILTPKMLGGITADGAIAITFGTGGNSPAVIQTGGRYAYIRNSHGWYSLSSVLAAQGVDLVAQGWDPTNMAVTGVRTVEGLDLVFGQGRRRTVGASGYVAGAQEGFVVELPAGALAAFNPAPMPPADPSIVGTWLAGASLTNPAVVASYLADGTFIRINLDGTGNPIGIERGLYTWAGNAAGGAFVTTTSYDSDGTTGVSSRNGQLGISTIVTGDTFTFTDTNCPGCAVATATRVTGSAGSVVGSWITPYPAGTDFQLVVLTGQSGGNRYYLAGHDSGGGGAEAGTYTWDPVSHLFVTTPPDTATITITLNRDELGATAVITEADSQVFSLDFTRIVAPSLVHPAFTGSSSIDGVVGFPFSFTPPTVYAASLIASGLPSGLSLDEETGTISGTPDTAGAFGVLLTAENSFGAITNAALTINITAPAVVVMPPDGGNEVVVEPEVPPGTPDVTLTFDTVAPGGGETTVAVIDPETTPELAPEPPANFQVVLSDGGVPLYYDIHTTADFGGNPVSICFNYAGVDFGGQTPRLFHYVNGEWVDITTSVDTVTQTLCGETTSFSTFAIFSSTTPFRTATGFYAPVSPIVDFVNSAKAGSTVPLKFDVYLNGVEKTDVTGITFTVTSSQCTASAEDPVDFVSSGNTSLRYEDGQFVQNWKTPREPGCYTVRVLLDEDGPAGEPAVVLLTTKFSLK